MTNPVPVAYNPVLARGTNGQLYVISGQVWIPVPDGTTRDDLDLYVSWQPPQGLQAGPEQRSWLVEGSKGSSYTVSERGGLWACSCKGYQFRRSCRHITEKRNEEEAKVQRW